MFDDDLCEFVCHSRHKKVSIMCTILTLKEIIFTQQGTEKSGNVFSMAISCSLSYILSIKKRRNQW